MTSSDHMQTDILIIGCGIAGGVAALELAEAGHQVTVVTLSTKPEESNTFYAQGGIVYENEKDTPELLIEDIMRAGAGLSNRRAVEILAHEGPGLVRSILLEKIGVPFDRTASDALSLVMEGGHSLHRILHAADMTGSAIERKLLTSLDKFSNVQLLTNHTAVDLLTPAHHALDRAKIYDEPSCVGAYVLNQKTGRVVPVIARKTILATGGLGQIFLRTTNPYGARGDGLAMAYRAGARVINAEFVQFHPTAFYQEGAPCFLISEAVRGAGARLVDDAGETFMQKYDPKWKDLAPRDVVARGMHQEMLSRGLTNVYLDVASVLPTEQIRSSFPSIYEACLANDIDITKDPVPVVPAAHYFCGGVWVDEFGRSTLRHLYAIGEVSCTGIHGANRLASTSLLEGLVWGYRSAQDIKQNISGTTKCDAADIPSWKQTGTEEPDAALIRQDMEVIKNIMWNYVGLVRTDRRLQRAIRELRHLEFEIERFYRAVQLTDGLIGLRNAVRSALIVAIAAWENKTSVGCHYRV